MRALLPTLTLASALACGGGEEVRWVELAESYRPPSITAQAEAWVREAADGTRVVTGEDGAWLEIELPASAWRAEELDGGYSVARPWNVAFRCAGRGDVRLIVDGRVLERSRVPTRIGRDRYFLGEERIFVALGRGAEAPRTGRFGVELPAGDLENGSWRVRVLDAAGDGFQLWPGHRVERTVDVHVASLRRKLGDAGHLVETVRGVGYRAKDLG